MKFIWCFSRPDCTLPLPLYFSQLEFQMWDGMVLRVITMCLSWIYSGLALKIYSTSVAGNFLWRQFSCLQIKWYLYLLWFDCICNYLIFINFTLMQAPLFRLTVLSLFTQNPSCIAILSQTTSSWAWVGEQIRYMFCIVQIFLFAIMIWAIIYSIPE